MGFLTASGCLSRVLGPVFVGYIYSQLGPIWTFSITLFIDIISMILIFIVNKRLIPAKLEKQIKLPETELQEYICNGENGGAMYIKK